MPAVWRSRARRAIFRSRVIARADCRVCFLFAREAFNYSTVVIYTCRLLTRMTTLIASLGITSLLKTGPSNGVN